MPSQVLRNIRDVIFLKNLKNSDVDKTNADELGEFCRNAFYRAMSFGVDGRYSEAIEICRCLKLQPDVEVMRRMCLNSFLATVIHPEIFDPKEFALECINLCQILQNEGFPYYTRSTQMHITHCEKSARTTISHTKNELKVMWESFLAPKTVSGDQDIGLPAGRQEITYQQPPPYPTIQDIVNLENSVEKLELQNQPGNEYQVHEQRRQNNSRKFTPWTKKSMPEVLKDIQTIKDKVNKEIEADKGRTTPRPGLMTEKSKYLAFERAGLGMEKAYLIKKSLHFHEKKGRLDLEKRESSLGNGKTSLPSQAGTSASASSSISRDCMDMLKQLRKTEEERWELDLNAEERYAARNKQHNVQVATIVRGLLDKLGEVDDAIYSEKSKKDGVIEAMKQSIKDKDRKIESLRQQLDKDHKLEELRHQLEEAQAENGVLQTEVDLLRQNNDDNVMSRESGHLSRTTTLV